MSDKIHAYNCSFYIFLHIFPPNIFSLTMLYSSGHLAFGDLCSNFCVYANNMYQLLLNNPQAFPYIIRCPIIVHKIIVHKKYLYIYARATCAPRSLNFVNKDKKTCVVITIHSLVSVWEDTSIYIKLLS